MTTPARGNGAPIVLVTRPEPDAAAFGARLRRSVPGPWRLVTAPLARIVPLPPPELAEGVELIVTSRNALRTVGAASLRGRRAWCVGGATAREACAAGLVPMGIGDGGADALVELILRAAPAPPLVHLSGEPSTGDVAARLRAAGLVVREAVVYRQEGLRPDAAFHDAIAAAAAGCRVVAPVFSPAGARRLSAAAGDAQLRAVALSPAVAQALRFPADRITTCGRPEVEAMVSILAEVLERGRGRAG